MPEPLTPYAACMQVLSLLRARGQVFVREGAVRSGPSEWALRLPLRI